MGRVGIEPTKAGLKVRYLSQSVYVPNLYFKFLSQVRVTKNSGGTVRGRTWIFSLMRGVPFPTQPQYRWLCAPVSNRIPLAYQASAYPFSLRTKLGWTTSHDLASSGVTSRCSANWATSTITTFRNSRYPTACLRVTGSAQLLIPKNWSEWQESNLHNLGGSQEPSHSATFAFLKSGADDENRTRCELLDRQSSHHGNPSATTFY